MSLNFGYKSKDSKIITPKHKKGYRFYYYRLDKKDYEINSLTITKMYAEDLTNTSTLTLLSHVFPQSPVITEMKLEYWLLFVYKSGTYGKAPIYSEDLMTKKMRLPFEQFFLLNKTISLSSIIPVMKDLAYLDILVIRKSDTPYSSHSELDVEITY